MDMRSTGCGSFMKLRETMDPKGKRNRRGGAGGDKKDNYFCGCGY